MIFYEGIEQEGTGFALQRQRNWGEKKWYGIEIANLHKNTYPSDNEKWITAKFIDQSKKKIKKRLIKLGFKVNDDDVRDIKKLFKEAVKLGWFDYLTND